MWRLFHPQPNLCSESSISVSTSQGFYILEELCVMNGEKMYYGELYYFVRIRRIKGLEICLSCSALRIGVPLDGRVIIVSVCSWENSVVKKWKSMTKAIIMASYCIISTPNPKWTKIKIKHCRVGCFFSFPHHYRKHLFITKSGLPKLCGKKFTLKCFLADW